MTPAVVLAVAAGLFLTPTCSATEVGVARPPVVLSVSPVRVALAAPASRAIRVRNLGTTEVVVETGRKSLGPRPPANRWVTIAPARLVLRPGSSAALRLSVEARPRAGPRDHHVLVLLVARPVAATRVVVRMRLGIVLRIRVPGRIVRSVELRSLRVLRRGGVRILLVSVANRGNVSEELRRRVTILLLRGRRVVARLRPAGQRELHPGMQAVFRARYAGRTRGLVRAVVTVRAGGAGRSVERRYRIRL